MDIHRRALLLGGVASIAGLIAKASAAGKPAVTVFKSPTCGCCIKWVELVRAGGFPVTVKDHDDLTPIKQANGVPVELQSCHTALVEGYVVEGHVPVDLIDRLLRERPAIAGIAVPGMPIGSPGMEVPGHAAERYQVMAFDRAGRTSVYASR